MPGLETAGRRAVSECTRLAAPTGIAVTQIGVPTVRKTVRLFAVSAAAAGLMAMGSPAFADSKDNDGINIFNDNNVSVLPIQACGNNVAVLGIVGNIGSSQNSQCVNAPIVDHPVAR